MWSCLLISVWYLIAALFSWTVCWSVVVPSVESGYMAHCNSVQSSVLWSCFLLYLAKYHKHSPLEPSMSTASVLVETRRHLEILFCKNSWEILCPLNLISVIVWMFRGLYRERSVWQIKQPMRILYTCVDVSKYKHPLGLPELVCPGQRLVCMSRAVFSHDLWPQHGLCDPGWVFSQTPLKCSVMSTPWPLNS